MFRGEKTFVFWFGLVVLSLASVLLFSILWYTVVIAQPSSGMDYYWRFLVPPVVGAIVFILIGLYMMRSGTRKDQAGKTQLLNQ